MTQAASPPVAAVELGGTKCVCLLGTGPDDISDRRRIPTGDAPATLAAIEAVLAEWDFAALGIAAFGPADVDPGSPGWGRILATPKPGWRGADVGARLRRRFGVPTGFDTDVNGAALAEQRWGAARGLDDFAYVTVGTGVGVGLIVRGRPAGGFAHAEAGHLRIARMSGDAWPGSCPFHADCVEGLASGPAIAARLGRPAETAGPDDPVWAPVAHALGQLVHNLVLTAAPQRVLLGGGIMTAHPHLLPRINEALAASLAGYVELPHGDYVVPPGLGADAGPCGALALALDAFTADRLAGEEARARRSA